MTVVGVPSVHNDHQVDLYCSVWALGPGFEKERLNEEVTVTRKCIEKTGWTDAAGPAIRSDKGK